LCSTPSLNDARNHIFVLETVVGVSQRQLADIGGPQAEKLLVKVLLEYLVNVDMKVFRSKAVFGTLDVLFKEHCEALTLEFLTVA